MLPVVDIDYDFGHGLDRPLVARLVKVGGLGLAEHARQLRSGGTQEAMRTTPTTTIRQPPYKLQRVRHLHLMLHPPNDILAVLRESRADFQKNVFICFHYGNITTNFPFRSLQEFRTSRGQCSQTKKSVIRRAHFSVL